MESREKHQWKARYYEAENLIMTLDGKDEQKTHEVSILKRELAKARKEIEEKDKLLMRDSKRARGARNFYARYCSYESESEPEDDPSTSYAWGFMFSCRCFQLLFMLFTFQSLSLGLAFQRE
jgi:hypothetical protein